jgi:hypothetical protein
MMFRFAAIVAAALVLFMAQVHAQEEKSLRETLQGVVGEQEQEGVVAPPEQPKGPLTPWTLLNAPLAEWNGIIATSEPPAGPPRGHSCLQYQQRDFLHAARSGVEKGLYAGQSQ